MSIANTVNNQTLNTNSVTQFNNLVLGLTPTVTSGQTITLTVNSQNVLILWGTMNATVVLPATPTLKLGFPFIIVSRTTGTVTINSESGALIATVMNGTRVDLFCDSIT